MVGPTDNSAAATTTRGGTHTKKARPFRRQPIDLRVNLVTFAGEEEKSVAVGREYTGHSRDRLDVVQDLRQPTWTASTVMASVLIDHTR